MSHLRRILLALALMLPSCIADRPAPLPDAEAILDSVTAAALEKTTVTTGGSPEVAWGYRFEAGEHFRMRKQTTSTNLTGSPRFFEGEDEVLFEVEKVDPDGTITLTMATLKNVMREKSGPKHPFVKDGYAARTPKIRARIDRFGEVIEGEILEDTEEHRRSKLAASQPGSGTHVVADLVLVRNEIDDFLPRLIGPSSLRLGESYSDTTLDARTARLIPIDTSDLNEPAPGKMKRSPFAQPTTLTRIERTIRTITPLGWVERDGERYLRLEETLYRDMPLPEARFEYRSSTELLVRKDGAIVRAERRGAKDLNGVHEGEWREIVEMLE